MFLLHSSTLDLRCSSMNSGEPKGAPRYGLPREVMLTPVSENNLTALLKCWSLVTNQVLDELAKYPKRGSAVFNLSHQLRRCMREPKAAESSAYQTCLHGLFSIWMRGIIARPYLAIASGSPCVVPSHKRKTSLSTKVLLKPGKC